MADRSHTYHRIAQDAEVRPAPNSIDWIRGPAAAVIVMGYSHRSEMTSCGRSHDPYFPWIQLPLLCSRPHHSNRSLHVLELHGIPVAVRPESVLKNESRHSHPVEKERIGATLVVGQSGIAAAWANHDRRPAGVFCGKDSEGGNILILPSKRSWCIVGPET